MLSDKQVRPLVLRAIDQGRESLCFEFKENLADFDQIAKTVSAIANSALVYEQISGAIIWGIHDTSLKVVGTLFDPYSAKVGNQSLIPWLHAQLNNAPEMEFYSCDLDGHRVVILHIAAPVSSPTLYKQKAYIRVDSHNMELSKQQSLERLLWSKLLNSHTEESIVMDHLSESELHDLLDLEAMGYHFGLNHVETISTAKQLGITVQDPSGLFAIPGWAALIYARSLSSFPNLARKSLRFLVYEGQQRNQLMNDLSVDSGYLDSYKQAIENLKTLLPKPERDVGALRTGIPTYSLLALNEALGNALTHQDLSMRGAGPIIEIFSNRIEICNPGAPLIEPQRLVNAPPQSRNEKLALNMRRLKLIQERGSGWDIIAMECARLNLPAPIVELLDQQFRLTFRPEQPLSQLTTQERMWTLYIHACLKWVDSNAIANADVRERFAIAPGNAATASRLLNDAVTQSLLKPFDPDAGRGQMKYIPFWA